MERPNDNTGTAKKICHKTGAALKAAGGFIAHLIYKYRYFFKKLGVALITLGMTVILIFFLLRLTPGDLIHNYAIDLAAKRNISYEEARALAVQLLNYDPDASIFSQFFDYIKGLLHGELGRSMFTETITANLLIKQRLPWTLLVSSVALFISFFLGVLLGSVMARTRSGLKDAAISTYVIAASSIPDYLLALLLVVIFAVKLKIFPISGTYDAFKVTAGFNFPFFGSVLYYAALPVLSSVIVQTATWTMLMRGSAIGVLGEDYIQAAKARGLSERTITRKYLRKNAMLPLVTSMAVTFGALFGGAPLLESIFNYKGIGLAISERIGLRDFFVVQGLLLFTSAMVIFVNLVTDSLYSLIDPRVRRDA